MTSERLSRVIDRLLQEATEALGRADHETAELRTRAVLALDPQHHDATTLLTAINRSRETTPASRPPSNATAATPALAATVPSKEFELGVLFVHGIGRQRSGATIVRWGETLMKAIGQATRGDVTTVVESAREGSSVGDSNVEAVWRLGLTAYNETVEERWLLAESYWADKFLAPSYRELVGWSVRALPWALASHIHQGRSEVWGRGRLATLAWQATAGGKLLIALSLTPVFALGLFASLLVGLLPIPRLRTSILSAQGALSATIGDCLAFVDSPIRAALIETTILQSIGGLKARCKRTVVVAHSQGAAAVVDALGGILPPYGSRTIPARANADVMPDALVTFGAGTNQLASLKALSSPSHMWSARGPVSAGVVASSVFAGLSLWIFLGDSALREVGLAAGMSIGCTATFIGASYALTALIRRVRRQAKDQPQPSRVGVATVVVLWATSTTGLLVYSYQLGLPGISTYLAVMSFLLLLTSVGSTFQNLQMWDVLIQNPRGLRHWIDIYASSDPVSNGPTAIMASSIEDAKVEIVKVWNLGSRLGDHTSYWDNIDGFVVRVINVCAATAGSAWQSWVPINTPKLEERFAWRVSWLRHGRFLISAVWFVGGVAVWLRYRSQVPPLSAVPTSLPSYLEDIPRFAVLATTVFLGVKASHATLTAIWRYWVRDEQEDALSGAVVGGMEWICLPLMGLLVGLLLGVAVVVLASGPSETYVVLSSNWVAFILAVAVPSIACSLLLLRLRPGPSDCRMHRER